MTGSEGSSAERGILPAARTAIFCVVGSGLGHLSAATAALDVRSVIRFPHLADGMKICTDGGFGAGGGAADAVAAGRRVEIVMVAHSQADEIAADVASSTNSGGRGQQYTPRRRWRGCAGWRRGLTPTRRRPQRRPPLIGGSGIDTAALRTLQCEGVYSSQRVAQRAWAAGRRAM